MPKILIIDDEKSILNTLREILEYEKYEVDEAINGKEGLKKIQSGNYDVILCDIKMPQMDGIEVLEKAHQKTDVPFIMISGHGSIETAVDAVKKGAYDFITKPPDLNRLLITIRNALDKNMLISETKVLKRKVTGIREIIGDSKAIQHIKDTIDRVAPTDARVLITGENGTGKELVARWIHAKSNRADKPLIEVNCAAIPSELIESELFGHEKGSFTSAIKQRIGNFEQANGGTLFLDEIGDMSQSAQAKVLRALQENIITRVGGEKPTKVDVRVLTATNKNLQKEIDMGNFRLDLYHRLSVIEIHVPSLNERASDIPFLAESFLYEICTDHGIPQKKFSKDAIKALQEITWTGNIRELHNIIERLVILGSNEITGAEVKQYTNPSQSTHSNGTEIIDSEDFQEFKDQMEKSFIEKQLKKNNWNVAKTADAIGIQRSHLYSKIEKFGLKHEK